MQRLMKTTKILFIAAASVAMTLASCTKEQTGTTENGQTSGLRTLTVSFATSPTRTTLDGMQPKWSENDEILLADGTNQETYTVKAAEAGKTSFEITTSLTGTIIAVYPKSAADITGNTINGIKVSNAPDGEFASANICMATAAATDNELSFENQTAVINVVVPDGTKKLTLTSLKPVGTSGQRTEAAVAIASESATEIIVEGKEGSNIPNPCYVSILPGTVLLQDLNVDVDDKAQGGFSPSAIVAKGKTPSSYAVEANTIYTLSESSLHEYVTVNGKKWATQNVAVTASGKKEFGSTGLVVGDYFQWASHAGYCGSASDADGGFLIYSAFTNKKCGDGADAFTFKSGVGQFYTKTDEDGVAWSPYCDNTTGNYDSKYSASTKTRLDLEDDAAFYFWGGAWRMPENGDFDNLLTKTTTTKDNFDAASGVLTIKGTSLQFPVAGFGSGARLRDAGSAGYYWSSSLSTDPPFSAYYLFFNGTNVFTYSYYRFRGQPVRPFSE